MEEGLHTSQYIVENSIDAILMTDSELQIAYSNRACNQLMGRNVTGQPLMSLWFEEDLPLLDSIIEWARVSGFFSTARLNGFHSVIDQYPGIEIVGTLAADWDREKGRQAAEEFLFLDEESALLGDMVRRVSGYIESRRLFEQIQTRAERERIIREISDKMQRATDMEALMRVTAEELNQVLSASRTYVRLGTEEELKG